MNTETKSFLLSKTLWANLIWILAGIARAQFGYSMSPEMEVAILGGINMVLRFVTKGPVTWQ